jgi:CRP/FNR family cyclic AMP-dependent transcriptional regulator
MVAVPDPASLGELALFRGLTHEELNALNGLLRRKTFRANSHILTIEEPGELVYIILSGTLKVHCEQASGADVIIAILGPGEVVGEISLVDSLGRSASVVTLEESDLLWMGRSAFNDCLRAMPAVNSNLVRILTGRLRLANEQIQSLATMDLEGRIARQLLALAERYGVPGNEGETLIQIRLTQGDIAGLVGASRERVNRVIVSYKERKFISISENYRITIHNRSALARQCQ